MSSALLLLGLCVFCTVVSPAVSCNRGSLEISKDTCTRKAIRDFKCHIKHSTSEKPIYTCQWKNDGDTRNSFTLFIEQKSLICIHVNECQNNTICVAKYQFTDWDISDKYNLTATVVGHGNDQKNCSVRRITGIPSSLTVCGSPSEVTFQRKSSQLFVHVQWGVMKNFITTFSVFYRVFNTTTWKEQWSINRTDCVIQNLTALLTYEMQIKCQMTLKCSQCLFGKLITVPPELLESPVMWLNIKDHKQDPFIQVGQRKVLVNWKLATNASVDHYNLTVRKVSGESSRLDSFTTKDFSLTLILSYSAHHIILRAVNTAGVSPASQATIPRVDTHGLYGLFRVNITSPNRFDFSWTASLSTVCFSVEWWAEGQTPASKAFYATERHREITDTKSAFQPYTRYYFFLHTRPDKNTCDMKNVNNSDTTGGAAQAFFTEGRPVSAPGNVNVLNITQHSSVVTWNSVPEKDLHGFLLGYNIYYMKDYKELSVKVNSSLNRYELRNLQDKSEYRVELSAFTAAGEGKRSRPTHFVTNPSERMGLMSISVTVLLGMVFLVVVLHLSCRVSSRAKSLFWPSIPNPQNSNAVQKVQFTHELDVLGPPSMKMLEESELLNAVSVIKEAVPLVAPPVFFLNEDGQDCRATLGAPVCSGLHALAQTSHVGFLNNGFLKTSLNEEVTSQEDEEEEDFFIDAEETKVHSEAAKKPSVVFMSDYTNIEFFQQVTVGLSLNPSIQTSRQASASGRPGQDYVRQSCFNETGFQTMRS